MLGLLNAAVFQLRLYLMKRRQFDNLALRKLFRERYDIDIGMYTYGCFDQWRMPGPIRIGRYCSFANTVRSAPINHPLVGARHSRTAPAGAAPRRHGQQSERRGPRGLAPEPAGQRLAGFRVRSRPTTSPIVSRSRSTTRMARPPSRAASMAAAG